MIPGLRGRVAAWFGGYRDACTGAFGRARSTLRPLCDGEDDIAFAAHITLGSVLRQTERHMDAEQIDRRGAELAIRDDQRCDAAVSLAADAVGRGDPLRAAEQLTIAGRRMPPGDRRLGIRLGWVRTEHALLCGDARSAAGHARVALAEANAAGWQRHIAKSSLFLGASVDALGGPEADRHLVRAVDVAGAIGAHPVADAARALIDRRRARSGAG